MLTGSVVVAPIDNAHGDRANFTVAYFNDTSWINYTNAEVEIYLGLEGSYIVDSIGYLPIPPAVPLVGPLPWLVNVAFNFGFAVCLAPGTPHWNHLLLDPSLGALFLSPPDTPGSLGPSGTSTATIVAASVVCGSVGVAIAAVAILSLTNNTFRNFLRPYLKRSEA